MWTSTRRTAPLTRHARGGWVLPSPYWRASASPRAPRPNRRPPHRPNRRPPHRPRRPTRSHRSRTPGGVLDAGTYLVTLYPVPFEVTVPDGWGTGGGGLWKYDPDDPTVGPAILLSFWPAYYVPTDACAWRGALVQIDPTAEAFVDAMTAQASTVSTPPVKVMVGDYSGFEFDHAAESDVDITGCDDSGGGRLVVRQLRSGGYLQRTRVLRKGETRNLSSGRPEWRARCARAGPIQRIEFGGDERGTRHLRLDRVRRTRRMTVRPVLAVSGEKVLSLRTGLRLESVPIKCPQPNKIERDPDRSRPHPARLHRRETGLSDRAEASTVEPLWVRIPREGRGPHASCPVSNRPTVVPVLCRLLGCNQLGPTATNEHCARGFLRLTATN